MFTKKLENGATLTIPKTESLRYLSVYVMTGSSADGTIEGTEKLFTLSIDSEPITIEPGQPATNVTVVPGDEVILTAPTAGTMNIMGGRG